MTIIDSFIRDHSRREWDLRLEYQCTFFIIPVPCLVTARVKGGAVSLLMRNCRVHVCWLPLFGTFTSKRCLLQPPHLCVAMQTLDDANSAQNFSGS